MEPGLIDRDHSSVLTAVGSLFMPQWSPASSTGITVGLLATNDSHYTPQWSPASSTGITCL